MREPQLLKLRESLNAITRTKTGRGDFQGYVLEVIETKNVPTVCGTTSDNLSRDWDWADCVDFHLNQRGSALRVHRCHWPASYTRVEGYTINGRVKFRVRTAHSDEADLVRTVDNWDPEAEVYRESPSHEKLPLGTFVTEHGLAQLWVGPVCIHRQ